MRLCHSWSLRSLVAMALLNPAHCALCFNFSLEGFLPSDGFILSNSHVLPGDNNPLIQVHPSSCPLHADNIDHLSATHAWEQPLVRSMYLPVIFGLVIGSGHAVDDGTMYTTDVHVRVCRAASDGDHTRRSTTIQSLLMRGWLCGRMILTLSSLLMVSCYSAAHPSQALWWTAAHLTHSHLVEHRLWTQFCATCLFAAMNGMVQTALHHDGRYCTALGCSWRHAGSSDKACKHFTCLSVWWL
jgi:hypothetical protein